MTRRSGPERRDHRDREVLGKETDVLHGRTLHPGSGSGELLVLGAPLSFWGGTDHTGTVIDARHPQHGENLAGRVVVMGSGRGSSSSSAVLAEQIRSHSAPAALLLGEPDTICVIGALAAAELYGDALPVVHIDQRILAELSRLTGADSVCCEVVADSATMTATVHLRQTGATVA